MFSHRSGVSVPQNDEVDQFDLIHAGSTAQKSKKAEIIPLRLSKMGRFRHEQAQSRRLKIPLDLSSAPINNSVKGNALGWAGQCQEVQLRRHDTRRTHENTFDYIALSTRSEARFKLGERQHGDMERSASWLTIGWYWHWSSALQAVVGFLLQRRRISTHYLSRQHADLSASAPAAIKTSASWFKISTSSTLAESGFGEHAVNTPDQDRKANAVEERQSARKLLHEEDRRNLEETWRTNWYNTNIICDEPVQAKIVAQRYRGNRGLRL
jgi:hypothetical protein